MDFKIIVALGLLGLMGFLFYPRDSGQKAPIEEYEWILSAKTLESETLRGAKIRKDNPVIKTYDLGYIFRIDRAQIEFDGLPKDYDILVSTNDTDYSRAVSALPASREYYYPVITFLPKEARKVQIVVNDWYGTQPKIKSAKIGTRYFRYGPVKNIRTKYNSEEAAFLIDGLKHEKAPKWLGAKRIEKEVEKDKKKVKEVTYESPGGNIEVTFDLGFPKVIYGIAVTTGGNENNLKKYEISTSNDGRDFQQVYVSRELENKFLTDSYFFNEGNGKTNIRARYIRLTVRSDGWYGKYPEIREVEIYSDELRPSSYNEPIENYNGIQIYYDNCGINNRPQISHLTQGFPFDRGEGVDANERFMLKPGDEVDPKNSPAERSFFYHYDKVIFSYGNLKPGLLYWVQVTYLQEKNGNRIQTLDVDGFLLHDSMEIPANEAKKYIYPIPPEAYKDGEIKLRFSRVAGPNAVVSEVKIFQANSDIQIANQQSTKDAIAKAPYISVPVVIDGALDEWPHVFPIVPQKYYNDPDNSPGLMYVQWDDDNLFLAFKFKTQGPNTVHLFADTNLNKSTGMYKTGDHHFRFSSADEKRFLASQIHHYLDAIPSTIDDYKEIQVAKSQTSDQYVLEIRIPKDKVLNGFSPRTTGSIGFNYVIDMPDSSRLFWSVPEVAASPALWGQLQLVGSVSGKIAIIPINQTFKEMNLIELRSKLDSGELGKDNLNFKAGEDILLVIWDSDQNTDRNSPESIKVSIYGDLTKDKKEIVLSEVSPTMKIGQTIDNGIIDNDSDVFVGRLTTKFGQTPDANTPVLLVQGKEIVTANYIDLYYGPNKSEVEVSAQTQVFVGNSGTISIVSQSGQNIENFNAGDKIFFKVDDKDLMDEKNDKPAEINIVVTSGGDNEKVILIDEKKTGIFIGSIQTAYGNPKPGDGIFQVVGQEMIKATYIDSIQGDGNTNIAVEAQAKVNTGSTGMLVVGKSETYNINDFVIVKNFKAGESILIFVKDSDINTKSTEIEQTEVKIQGNSTSDTVNLKLIETEPDSGTFSGVLITLYSLMADKENNILEVRGGEEITITYQDALQSSGATQVPISYTVYVDIGNDGTLSLVQSNYIWDLKDFNAGDTIYFRLEDSDLNINPGVKDFVDISVVSEETRDTETVSLEERSPNAGVFLGALLTKYANVAEPPAIKDGILQVRGGEKVTGLYLDRLRSTGETNVPVIDSARVNAGTNSKFTIYTKSNLNNPVASFPDQNRINRFKVGEILVFYLEDPDLNVNKASAEMFQISISEEKLTDSENVTLLETGENTGIFTGEIKTEYSLNPIPGDKTLQVRGGSVINVFYLDAINHIGETNIPVVVSLKIETGQTGLIQALSLDKGNKISIFNPGDSFIVRVQDADLNIDPDNQEKVMVNIIGDLLKDQLQITLQETHPNSGIFEGTVTSENASAANLQDPVIQIKEKEMVTITYIDSVTESGAIDVPLSLNLFVRSGVPSLIIVDENQKELQNFNAGRKLYFMLDDFIYSTIAPNAAPRITIQGDLTKDKEEIFLEEKAGERGIYSGFIPTSFGNIGIPDGILQVIGGETVKAIYLAQGLEEGENLNIADDVYVNKGDSGKIFIIGENGIKLNNFNAGDKLYFKLEDQDLKQNPLDIDNADIWVSGDAIASGRKVRLKETELDSGVFTGSIETRYGKGAITSPDVLEVVGGEQVTAVYYDALTSSGETDVKVTDSCRANMIGIASFAPAGVVIDGSMSGWPLENALRAGDEGSNLYVQWDNNNLYILAYIVDTEVIVPNPDEFWNGADALEIHIDTDPTRDKSKYLRGLKDPNYYFFWICPKGGGIDKNMPYVGQSLPETIYDYKDIEVSARIFPGSRYVLEARIPWKSALGGFDPNKSTNINSLGFNYVIRKSNALALRWARGPEKEMDIPPSSYGTLIFRR